PHRRPPPRHSYPTRRSSDLSWRIARTNRSLASYLGVPPVALVGEAMSSLRQIAEAGSDLPCPFCRDTQRKHEEYERAGKVASCLDRKSTRLNSSHRTISYAV